MDHTRAPRAESVLQGNTDLARDGTRMIQDSDS